MKSSEQMIVGLMQYCNNSVGQTRRLQLIKKDLSRLKQLEDIEKEIGIDLITLVRLLKEPIYYLCLGPIAKAENFKVDLNEKAIVMNFFMGNSYEVKLYFKDYGKEWALTREELVRKNDNY